MKIGIDLHSLGDLLQGSRTYIANLTKSLLRIDAENEYSLYLPSSLPLPPGLSLSPGRKVRRSIPSSRLARIAFSFSRRLRRDGVRLFHCQYMGPLFCPCPYIVSIHDIIHETRPEFYPRRLRLLMRLFYPFSARRAARVITGSRYTRAELVRLYGLPEEKVVVTPYGASAEFQVVEDRDRVRRAAARYGITGDYILFVGRIEPRKNLRGLLAAYEILAADSAVRHKLVIAGMKDPLFPGFFDGLLSPARIPEVIFTGRVSPEDLVLLYNGADLFVYPSFAEGFGLPVLEAMSCGLPVITSNATSLPEVAGDAGIAVDPDDRSGLAAAIRRVLGDNGLREELGRRSLRQARRFSWERTAEQTLEVYREVFREARSGSFPGRG